MDSITAEAVARIQCDIGVNNVHVRPISFKGWAILHQLDMYHAETIFSAKTKEECEEVIRLALKEVKA